MNKRLLDIVLATALVLIFGIIILMCIALASIDTRSIGIFTQKRIGKYGKPFTIFKIKTLNDNSKVNSKFGAFLRNTKIDELPQLINILNGTMSFVGPRPDISGYADNLKGDDRLILTVRPGVTGLASLKYRTEEQILSLQKNQLHYNDSVMWPDKVSINKWYVQNRTYTMDLLILYYTIIPLQFDIDTFIQKHNSK